MNYNQSPWFNDMITKLEEESLFKNIIFSAKKKYQINLLNLEVFSPSKVLQLINKLLQKNKCAQLIKLNYEIISQTTFWAQNEFQLFSWISICYASLNQKQLGQFNSIDFIRLSQIFPQRSPQFLQYNLKRLFKQKAYQQKWSSQQMDLLVQIVKIKEGILKWGEISYLLFLKSSEIFYRSPQKCRQQWINHLDPSVNRTKWTLAQDLNLFQAVNNQGYKWARISKLFGKTRTQHMIKNRFNSIYKRYKCKSQRTGTQAIFKKVIDNLEKRINNLKLKILKQTICEEKTYFCGERNIKDRSCGFNIQQKSTFIKYELQTDIKINSSTTREFMQDIDLNEMMFSEKSYQINLPVPDQKKWEIIEIDLFSDYMTGNDHDPISLFLS